MKNDKDRLREESLVGDILKRIIVKNKLQSGIDSAMVKELWGEVMGSGVRSYTRDVILKKDVLYVSLTSSVLREELSHRRSRIVEMLNEELRRDLIREVILR